MKYRTHPEFERGCAALCIIKPAVWRRVGRHVRPDALNSQEAILAFGLMGEIAAEAGVPGGLSVIYQTALGKVEDGTLAEADYARLVNWLEDANEDMLDGQWDPDALTTELVKTVRRFDTDQGATEVIDAWGKGKQDKIAEGLEKVATAQRLGESADRGAFANTLDQRIAEIKRAGVFNPLETGIGELDAMLGGGGNRGCVMCVGGGTGDGKSIFESQQAAVAMVRGLFVGYASTEIRPYLVSARLDAALFGLKIDDIRADPDIVRPYYEEHGDRLGQIRIKHFMPPPGQHTTMSDVEDWIKEIEDNAGRALDVLLLDPVNRLRPRNKKFAGGSYSMGEFVVDDVCQLTDDRNLWTTISSHTQREKKGAYWTENNLADSQQIARLCDGIFTVNGFGVKPNRTVAIYVCKDREGGGRGVIGPYPAQYAYGRILPMTLLDAADPYADL